jgi:nucleotide-binding universal stress UspA family protein
MRLIQHKKEAYWFYRFLSLVYDRWVNPLFWTPAMREQALALARLDDLQRIADELGRQVRDGARYAGVEAEFVAARGDPFVELCRVATELRADAVVVGASASAGHRIMGSLAVRLVRAGRWPVTVVP